MRNYINKNIDTSIKWNWEGRKLKNPKRNWDFGRTTPRATHLNKGQKIIGLNIWDKTQKNSENPNGYCGSIELTTIGGNLQIWTNGKYQFIKKEIAIKLFEELLKRLKENPKQ